MNYTKLYLIYVTVEFNNSYTYISFPCILRIMYYVFSFFTDCLRLLFTQNSEIKNASNDVTLLHIEYSFLQNFRCQLMMCIV